MLNPYYWLLLGLESAAGSTIYALLCLFILAAVALVVQFRAKRGGPGLATNLALLALLGLRLAELPTLGRTWLSGGEGANQIPLLERSVLLFGIVLIIWLWLRLAPNQTTSGLLAAFTGMAALFSGALFWFGGSVSANGAFNYSTWDYLWGVLCAIVLVSGLLLLVRNRPPAWRAGLVQLSVLLLGVIAHVLLAEPGANMPLGLQVANLLVLPLLAFIPILTPDQGEAKRNQPVEDQMGSEPDWALLCEELCLEMEADLAFIGSLGADEGVLNLISGYNASSSGSLPAFSLNLDSVPRLATALKRGRSLRLAGGERHYDLSQIADTLGLPMEGHLLAAPLGKAVGLGDGAVLLLRIAEAWLVGDEEKLNKILHGEAVQSQPAEPIEDRQPFWDEEYSWLSTDEDEGEVGESDTPAVGSEDSDARGLVSRLSELEEENQHYRQEVERLLSQLQQTGNAGIPDLGADLLHGILPEEQGMQAASGAMEERGLFASNAQTAETQQATEELRLALQEVARLHALLQKTKEEVEGVAANDTGVARIPAEKSELIMSIAQDLRQPLTSVLGYTDLLLGESVGTLGDLQRSYLERVHDSTERMNQLIGNLVQIAEIDSIRMKSAGEMLHLADVIERVLDQVEEQRKHKRIDLQLEVGPDLPEMEINRDALEQVVFHLLENAMAATPEGGQVALRASTGDENGAGGFILIQVADTGGGIREDDLPHVFSRVYRTSNPLIQGVGDTGVGLSIAEALSKALGGKIWVDSQQGLGATYSLVLPVSSPGAM